LGIAHAFAAQGCSVLLSGLESAGEVAPVLGRFSRQDVVFYVQGDLGTPRGCQELISQAQEKLKGVDILVNNAGIQYTATVQDFPDEKWQLILALNLFAAFYTSKAVLPALYAQGWGRLIHISLTHGLVGSVHKAAYVAAKHGLVGLSKALEAAGTGVTSNCICPGFVLTPLVQKQIEDVAHDKKNSVEAAKHELIAEKHPSKEFVKVEDLAAMAVLLASPAGDKITGAAYNMDGGWSAH